MNRKIVLAILVVLSLLAVGFSEVYLPIIVKAQDDPGGTTVIPSGVLYVFSSSGTTTGNAGGRTGIQAFCTNDDPDAHLCGRQEIIHAVDTIGAHFAEPFLASWLNNGPYAQGCGFWDDDSPGEHGSLITDDAKTNISPAQPENTCDHTYHVACCKLIP